MTKYFALVLALLTGCTHVPVYPPFPQVPEELFAECPDLASTPEDTEKLSEVISIVTKNYSQYHQCRLRVNTWQEWYKEQKKIYEMKP